MFNLLLLTIIKNKMKKISYSKKLPSENECIQYKVIYYLIEYSVIDILLIIIITH